MYIYLCFYVVDQFVDDQWCEAMVNGDVYIEIYLYIYTLNVLPFSVFPPKINSSNTP